MGKNVLDIRPTCVRILRSVKSSDVFKVMIERDGFSAATDGPELPIGGL